MPVRYPEMARETLQVEPDESAAPTAPVQRGEPITITPDDLESPGDRSAPVRQPQITIGDNAAHCPIIIYNR